MNVIIKFGVKVVLKILDVLLSSSSSSIHGSNQYV